MHEYGTHKQIPVRGLAPLSGPYRLDRGCGGQRGSHIGVSGFGRRRRRQEQDGSKVVGVVRFDVARSVVVELFACLTQKRGALLYAEDAFLLPAESCCTSLSLRTGSSADRGLRPAEPDEVKPHATLYPHPPTLCTIATGGRPTASGRRHTASRRCNTGIFFCLL